MALLRGRALPILCIAATALGINPVAPGRPRHLSPGMPAVALESAHQLELHTSAAGLVHTSERLSVETAAGKYLWLLGIPISICGATMTVCGLMVQKSSYGPIVADNGLVEEENELPMFYCWNLRWVAGFLLFVMGNLITWIALGLAPNSVLSCFNSWNIILTMVIAPVWFGEVISTRTQWCAGALVLGCCWVAITGPRSYRLQTVDHLNTLFGFPAFRVCTVCVVAFYLASMARYFYVRSKKIWEPITAWQIISMASISASYAVIFSKCTSSLVQASLVTHHSELKNQFFVYAFFSVVCGISQLHFVNEGLKHAKASFVIPIYESMSMAMQIVVGGMLFHEYAHFSFWHHVRFWPGVCVVLGGVVCLVKFADEDCAPEKGGNPQEPHGILIESNG